MANLKTSKKDVRKIQKRKLRNIPQKTRLRTLGKRIYELISKGDTEGARKFLDTYYRYLDRAGRKRLIPPRRACRYKSRAAKFLNESTKTASPLS